MGFRWGSKRKGFMRREFVQSHNGPIFPPIDRFKLWGVMIGETFIGVTQRVGRGEHSLDDRIRQKRREIQTALDAGDHSLACKLDREERALWATVTD